MITRILAGVNATSASEAVCAYAIDLARQHQASITGLSFLSQAPVDRWIFGFGKHQGLAKSIRDDMVAQLKGIRVLADRFEQQCDEAGIRCEMVTSDDDPQGVMLSRSRFKDVTVVGPGGWNDFDFIDDPLEHLQELVHHAVLPILCVPKVYHPVRRVLLVLDNTPHACQSFRHFVQLAPWQSAAVDLVVLKDEEYPERSLRFVNQAQTFAVGHGLQMAERLVVEQLSAEEILKLAEKQACNAIVTPVVERHSLKDLLLGERHELLLKQSDIPVLIMN